MVIYLVHTTTISFHSTFVFILLEMCVVFLRMLRYFHQQIRKRIRFWFAYSNVHTVYQVLHILAYKYIRSTFLGKFWGINWCHANKSLLIFAKPNCGLFSFLLTLHFVFVNINEINKYSKDLIRSRSEMCIIRSNILR